MLPQPTSDHQREDVADVGALFTLRVQRAARVGGAVLLRRDVLHPVLGADLQLLVDVPAAGDHPVDGVRPERA